MPPWLLITCLHPIAKNIALMLLLAALLYLGLARFRLSRYSTLHMVIIGVSVILVLLLGSYGFPLSPLLSSEDSAVQEFLITRPRSGRQPIPTGGIVIMAAGSVIQIEPHLLHGPADCAWSSSSGGAFDEPFSCDTAYAAPAGPLFDSLRISIRPACGGTVSVERVKISILP